MRAPAIQERASITIIWTWNETAPRVNKSDGIGSLACTGTNHKSYKRWTHDFVRIAHDIRRAFRSHTHMHSIIVDKADGGDAAAAAGHKRLKSPANNEPTLFGDQIASHSFLFNYTH